VKSIHEETNGNLREALRYAEEAWRRLQGLPEFPILAPSILSQLGILHGRIGRAQRAMWFLERGIELTEGLQQQKARIRWATILVAQGRVSDAEAALKNIAMESLPEPMTVELAWLRAEIGLMNADLAEAERQYERAIDVAQQHQVVYEEFLCQLGLASTQAFQGDVTRAMEHLARAQELVSDRSDQLAYRFREILVFQASGIYNAEHAVRELSDAAAAFGDMGLLQEQGFVRFHIARLKQDLGDPTLPEELAALDALGKSLQNPSFLQREIGFSPEMKAYLRTTPATT
jgi:ATP/maltotriose-dependent transcriptional regulator MalT